MSDVLIAVEIVATSNLAEVSARDSAALRTLGDQSAATSAKMDTVATASTRSTAAIDAGALRAARSLTTMGLAVGGVALGIDILSGKSAVNFQRSMELVHTEAGASQAEVDKLSGSILNLSGPTATGPDALSASLYHVESAGLRSAAALDLTKEAAIGAHVGMADLESVTNALIAVDVSHIAGVKSQQDAMAQLNAIVGTGNMRMQDLTGALGTGLLTAAHTVGLSLQDVGAAMATLTDNAIPAEQGATRLRMTFAMMADPKANAVKAFAEIGLSATQLATDMRKPSGLLVAVQDLKAHLDTLGTDPAGMIKQGQVLAEAFGGGRNSAVIETLINEVERLSSKYQQQAALVAQYGDAVSKTTQTEAYQFETAQAAAQKLSITTGDVLLPIILDLSKGMDLAAKTIEGVETAAPGLVTGLSAVALGVGAVSLAAKAGMAVWQPYGVLLHYLTGSSAEAAGGQAAVAAEIEQTGAAAAEATPELGAFVGIENGLVRAQLDLAASTLTVNDGLVAEGAEAEATAGSMGLMSGALDLLMGPVGIAALGVALGVIAYDKSPAFRSAVQDAGAALEKDLRGGSYAAQDGLNALGASIDSVGHRLDLLGSGSATGQKTVGAALLSGLGDEVNAFLPGAKLLSDYLQSEADKHDKDALAAARHAAALRDLKTAGQEIVGKNLAFTMTGTVPTTGTMMDIPQAQLQQQAGVSGQGKSFDSALKAAQGEVTRDLNAVANQLRITGPSLTEFTDRAIAASIKEQNLADDLAKAKITVEEGAGQWAQALRDQTSLLQTGYDNARAHLILAILDHAANVRTLAKAAADASNALFSVSGKGSSAADKLIALEGGHVSTTLHSIADDLNKRRSDLQKAFDNAVARLVDDQRPGSGASPATISADESNVAATRSALKTFNHDVTRAGKAGEQAARSFLSLSDAAEKRAKTALDNYALGIEEHSKDLGTLHDKAVAEAQGADLFTKALATATKNVHSVLVPQTGPEIVQKHTTDLQNQYQYWLAQTVLANKDDTHQLVINAAGLASSKKALDDWNKKLAEAAPKPKPAGQAGAQSDYDRALAHDAKDIRLHGEATRADKERLLNTSQMLATYTDSTASATAWIDKMSVSIQSFTQILDADKAKVDSDLDAIDKAILGGYADRQTRGGPGGEPGVEPGSRSVPSGGTFLEKDLAKYAKDYAAYQAGLDAQLEGQRRGAVATGQWATVLGIDLKKVTDALGNASAKITEDFLSGSGISAADQAALDHASADQERANLAKQKSDDAATTSMIRAALAAGDFAGAAELASKQITESLSKAQQAGIEGVNTGQGPSVIGGLASSFEAAQKAADQWTQSTITWDRETGQFSEALNLITTTSTKNYQEGLDGLTLTILDHQQVTQGDIDAIKRNREATEAETQAKWDATFLTGSTSQQSQMLIQSVSGIISNFNTMAGAEGSVASAKLTVLSDESAVQVSLLQELVTETADQTSVIEANTGVLKAAGDITLASIKGMTDIAKAQEGIATARRDIGTAATPGDRAVAEASLAVAEAQLQVSIDTAREGQLTAQWTMVEARDNVRIATDKATADRLNAAAQQRIALDKLAVSVGSEKLAEDQLALTADTLPVLQDIAAGVGGSSLQQVADYQAQIQRDLSTIGADQAAIGSANATLSADTSAANQLAIQQQLVVARDSQQLAIDTQSATASSIAGQTKIALDNYALQGAQYQLQQAQYSLQQQTASSMESYYQQQLGIFQRWFSIYQSGGFNSPRNASLTGGAFMNQFSIDAHGSLSR